MFLCLMESQKMFEDECFKNSDYAEICGISAENLLQNEYDFLRMLDFNLYIGSEEFDSYKENFVKYYQ